jgi:hypothetical protein
MLDGEPEPPEPGDEAKELVNKRRCPMRLISLVLVLALAPFAGATHPYVQNVVVRQRIVQPYVQQVVVQQPIVQAVYAQSVVQQVQFQQVYQHYVQQVQAYGHVQQVQAFSNYHAVQPVVVRQNVVVHRHRQGFFGRLFGH